MSKNTTPHSHILNRRDFLKNSIAGVGAWTLNATGISLAANALVSTQAFAKNYDIKKAPPAFQPHILFNGINTDRFVANRKFNTQQEMAYMFMELSNSKGDSQLQHHMLLANNPRNSHVTNLPTEVWYCDTFQHSILCNMFMNTHVSHFFPDKVLWNNGNNERAQNFYHNLTLSRGIHDFYSQFVKRGRIHWGAEKMLVHALFSAAEPYPINGKQKAQQYLKANFDERTKLISELRDTYNSFDVSDKEALRADRDISGTQGKGPLNNWYRLVSAQGAAFFLTCYYRKLENRRITDAKQNGDLVNKNIEKEIRKRIPKLRGPHFYVSRYETKGYDY